MGVEGYATHHGDGTVLKPHELGASILGGVVGDALENLSIQADLGVDELAWDIVLEHMDRVGGIQHDLGLAVGDEVAQPVGAIDDARCLVLDAQVEVGALCDPVREEADRSGETGRPFHAWHADSLLPQQSSLRDFNGKWGAAEVVGELCGVDGRPDAVASEVAHRIKLGQIDGARDRLARSQLNRFDFIVRICRRNRAAIECLDLESKPFLSFHVSKKETVSRKICDADRCEKRFVGNVEIPLEGEVDHNLSSKVTRQHAGDVQNSRGQQQKAATTGGEVAFGDHYFTIRQNR